MRQFLTSSMLLGLAASLLCSAQMPPNISNSAKSSPKEEMMPMPLVAPLFIEDGTTENYLTIVRSADSPASFEVKILDLRGQTQGRFSKAIPGHGQVRVRMSDELSKLHLDIPFVGSLIVTPNPTKSDIAAQLSIVRNSVVPAEYIEEELPMIDSSGKNVFHAVATGAVAQPLVEVRSASTESQNISLTCIVENKPRIQQKIALEPGQGKLLHPCSGQDVRFAGLDQIPKEHNAKRKVIGLSIQSDGMAGSFVAFGLAPRTVGPSLTYEPLAFQQSSNPGPSTAIYPGIPLGITATLQSLDFQPEIGLANFGADPAHVAVSFTTRATGDSPQPLGSFTVPPYATIRAVVPKISGDPDLANSIAITAGDANADVASNVRVTSLSDPLHFVEIPDERLTKPTNGGQQPWMLGQNTNSLLLLYNGTSSKQSASIRIYADRQMWAETLKLDAYQTATVDLRSLVKKRTKDSHGRILEGNPDRELHGMVNWSSLQTKAIFGRVMQVDSSTLQTRNFSCVDITIACGAAFDYGWLYIPFQNSAFNNGYAYTCSSVGACTCDGSCPYSAYQDAFGYSWTVDNSSIASISSGSSSQEANFYGNSVNQTNFDLSVNDVNGCYASGQGTVQVKPTLVLGIANGTTSYTINRSNGTITLYGSVSLGGEAGPVAAVVSVASPANPSGVNLSQGASGSNQNVTATQSAAGAWSFPVATDPANTQSGTISYTITLSSSAGVTIIGSPINVTVRTNP